MTREAITIVTLCWDPFPLYCVSLLTNDSYHKCRNPIILGNSCKSFLLMEFKVTHAHEFIFLYARYCYFTQFFIYSLFTEVKTKKFYDESKCKISGHQSC